MTVYIEKLSSSRELGKGTSGEMEELLSIPKIIIRRTEANGIILDDDKVRHLNETELEDIEKSRRLSYEPNPDEPLKIRICRGVWGGIVGVE